MFRDQDSTLSRVLPVKIFERLQIALKEMAEAIEGAVVFTEDLLASIIISPEQQVERFVIVVSHSFSALLIGKTDSKDELELFKLKSGQHTLYPSPLVHLKLTFEPKAIASFLSQLAQWLHHNQKAHSALESFSQNLQPNDAKVQSKFTLLLLEILSLDSTETCIIEPIYPHVSICQPIEDALRQQMEQERLLNKVTTQILKSLELPVILKTAVEQVRSLLQVDRLLIYQFEYGHVENQNFNLKSGLINYESRSSEEIPTVNNFIDSEDCFFKTPSFKEKYCAGFNLIIEDTENAYIFSPCLLDLMREMKVRAKLVVPIVVQEQLWGLLIAHQCFEPRRWQEREKKFLQYITEYLAIAIYQSQLYAEVQQKKNTLEQRVIERTQALYDALLAAQSANQAKTEFLATISHELRTPLTCVIGLSSTLLHWSFHQEGEFVTQKQPTVPAHKQRKYLQSIHDSGQHLLDLINGILELSQVEAGKAVLNIKEFSLVKLAKQSLQTLSEKANSKGINLSIDLRTENFNNQNEAEPFQSKFLNLSKFIADEQRVKQIIFNLLSNAIKFTPKGGQVTFRVWRENDTAVFQVEDTGIGIPEHQLPLIFEKFQQLEPSYQRTYEGIGLGLALTKQLVELHGGRIEVESIVGAGSTFTVWLPAQSLEQDQKDSSLNFPNIQKGSIALMEDNEEVASLICNILMAAGYQVVWLMEGVTAIEKIKLLEPQLVILDIHSSESDSYQFVHRLRQSQLTKPIKILGLTTIQKSQNLQFTIPDEIDNYVVKPIEPENLISKITAMISNYEPKNTTIRASI